MYGRKMMKGLLSSKGIIVAENRIGKSLKRVDPSNHTHRASVTYFRTNPTPYTASYFGHKVPKRKDGNVWSHTCSSNRWIQWENCSSSDDAN